jgi:hypothetical protein
MERSVIRGNLFARDPAFRFAPCGLHPYPAFNLRALRKSALMRVCQPVPVLR